jgi:DNA-binding NtrC family response regulator
MTHVLLVEDHARLRHILGQMLTAMGLKVTAAESGDHAVRLLATGLSPDVLLSDIRMPGGLDGLGLARWVQAHNPSMVILLQTGFAEISTSEFRILRKPVAPEQLLAAIEEGLRCCVEVPAK